MKLLLISASNNFNDEHIILKKMFEIGLPTLHLRKPHLSAESLKAYIDAFSKEEQRKIIIHTHHSLLWDYKLKGIHLTKTDRKRKLRSWFMHLMLRLRRGRIIRTTSCSSLSSLAASYNDFNYIMLTPVFTGPQEHRPTFSRGTLNIVLKKYPDKITARGGAKIDSIEKAKELGFSGIVFHNSIWKSGNPIEEMEKVIARFKELNIPIE